MHFSMSRVTRSSYLPWLIRVRLSCCRSNGNFCCPSKCNHSRTKRTHQEVSIGIQIMCMIIISIALCWGCRDNQLTHQRITAWMICVNDIQSLLQPQCKHSLHSSSIDAAKFNIYWHYSIVRFKIHFFRVIVSLKRQRKKISFARMCGRWSDRTARQARATVWILTWICVITIRNAIELCPTR